MTGYAAPELVVGYVPGAWDVFHIGHLNILLRAREQCDRLIVGVVTDEALFEAKDKWPMVPLDERLDMVRSLDLVDDVVIDHSSNKLEVWQRVGFDVLFKGDDWRGTAKGYKLEAGHGVSGREGSLLPVHRAHLEQHVAVHPRRSLTQPKKRTVASAMRETIDSR